LDAIRALKTFVAAHGDNYENLRAFQSNATRWLNLPQQVFEIEVEIAGSQYVYRLENDVSHPNSSASVAAESLKVDGTPILEVTKGEAILYPNGPAAPIGKFGVSDSSSALPILSASRKEAGVFVDWFSKQLFCLKIVPDTMLSMGKFDGQTHPLSNLSDLAAWYMQLAGTDVESVISLRDSLKQTITGFASLQFTGLESGVGELRTSFNSPGKPIYLGLDELSDGQRSLIALYMILHFLIEKGCTVILDEPDNFISLREIQPWLLAAEEAVENSNGQLILISHHPEILNQWSQEYGLRFFREENGHVRTEKFKTDYDGLLQPSELIARGWENE
jgi:hypothetical protein